jgi:hypothetical protein
MFYNNTASINYLEFDRLNPSSSIATVNGSITASFISASDYQGTTQFLNLSQYGIDTFNTNVLAPSNTSENVTRTMEILNNKIPNNTNKVGEVNLFWLTQQTSNVNNKIWRAYLNSTGSLAGATLFNTAIRTTNAQSSLLMASFYVSESVAFYIDNSGTWDSSNKSLFSYDIISSSLWLIVTVQKATAADVVRDHYAIIYGSVNNTLAGEPTPL